jgi:osmoprotectant transport system substrate-binding protein
VRSALVAFAALVAGALVLGACGHGKSSHGGITHSATATAPALPGAGKPEIMIGDKNFTEQFLLGELYRQALVAQGFTVSLSRNIGPTEVTLQALQSGRLDMYPEYIETWNRDVAKIAHTFGTASAAYRAGQRYALAHGLELLDATPFSDTDAIGVTVTYAAQNGLRALGDLQAVASNLTLGAPPQFQQDPRALPLLEQVYGFTPAAVKSVEIGDQYQALDHGSIQAADVQSTDGELTTGKYQLLRDPLHVLGWGNVVPVISTKLVTVEGPAFAATVNRVTALLTTTVMRRLNAAIDVSHQDPMVVAKQFLQTNGLVPVKPKP